MNFTYYEGKDVNVKEMIDLAETMPFLSDRRVILLENTGLFKSGGDELASYLESPCESTYFIFSEREVDKRSKAYKAVTNFIFYFESEFKSLYHTFANFSPLY